MRWMSLSLLMLLSHAGGPTASAAEPIAASPSESDAAMEPPDEARLIGDGCPKVDAPVKAAKGYRVSYQVSASAANGVQRRQCSIVLPVEVPAGQSMAFGEVSYSVKRRLPVAGARADSHIEVFHTGAAGQPDERHYAGPDLGGETATVAAEKIRWTACSPAATRVLLRMKSALTVEAGDTGELAEATLKIRARVRQRDCD